MNQAAVIGREDFEASQKWAEGRARLQKEKDRTDRIAQLIS